MSHIKHPKVSITARRLAREGATQAIYQWELNKMPDDECLRMYKQIKPLSKKIDKSYFETLIVGVIQNYERLDQLLKPFLKKDLYHLGEVEKAIFRIAVYELVFLSEEVDASVVINEAVDMAKYYTADKSYTFVNAVLDGLSKQLADNKSVIRE